MSQFNAFMAQNVIKCEPVKTVVSNRFVTEDGEPETWLVGCITGAEDEELRRQAARYAAPPGESRFRAETDYNTYLGLLAARCTLYPDLNDAALQNSYGVLSPDALLKTMLTAGEYAEYAARVQEICGFDMREAVDTAKK